MSTRCVSAAVGAVRVGCLGCVLGPRWLLLSIPSPFLSVLCFHLVCFCHNSFFRCRLRVTELSTVSAAPWRPWLVLRLSNVVKCVAPACCFCGSSSCFRHEQWACKALVSQRLGLRSVAVHSHGALVTPLNRESITLLPRRCRASAGEAVQEAAGGDPAHEAVHRLVRYLLEPGSSGQVPPETGEESERKRGHSRRLVWYMTCVHKWHHAETLGIMSGPGGKSCVMMACSRPIKNGEILIVEFTMPARLCARRSDRHLNDGSGRPRQDIGTGTLARGFNQIPTHVPVCFVAQLPLTRDI